MIIGSGLVFDSRLLTFPRFIVTLPHSTDFTLFSVVAPEVRVEAEPALHLGKTKSGLILENEKGGTRRCRQF